MRPSGSITLREEDISEQFVRSRGPGGQHVNKASTAVQLRFDLERSDLPRDVKDRARALAGGRLDRQGRIVIEARRFRSLEQNRRDARQRLVALLERASAPPKARVARKGESRRARAKRVDAKRRQGAKKRLRERPGADD